MNVTFNQWLVVGIVGSVFLIVSLFFIATKQKRKRSLACFQKAISGYNAAHFATAFEVAQAAKISQKEATKMMDDLVFWRVLTYDSPPNGEKYYRKIGTPTIFEYQKTVLRNELACS